MNRISVLIALFGLSGCVVAPAQPYYGSYGTPVYSAPVYTARPYVPPVVEYEVAPPVVIGGGWGWGHGYGGYGRGWGHR